jgi:integrase
MATTNFILRGTKSDKPQSITLLFRYGNKHLKYSTGFKTHVDNWNSEKQELRNKVEVADRNLINDGLNELRARISSIYTELIKDGKQVDNQVLRARLDEEKEPKRTNQNSPYVQKFLANFLESIDQTVQIKSSGKTEPLKESTIKQYRNTLKTIAAFDKKRGKMTQFKDLNLTFHNEFLNYLHQDQKLAYSTIAGRIKNLKSLSRYALRADIDVCEDVFTRGFFKPTDESFFTYLNEKEIEKIIEFDFSKNLKLDNARDLFVIGLWTGLRVSDFNKISKSNIINGYFEIDEQFKTGQPTIIPIHPHVFIIMKKYGDDFPRIISPQRFNDYVKEICRQVGFTELTKGTKKVKTDMGQRKITGDFPKYELISSHTCRRSFATNLYGKIPTMTIMAITGHKSERTFLNYIKVTPAQHAKALQEYWSNQSNVEQPPSVLRKIN